MVATGEKEALAAWLHEAAACSGFLIHPVERAATLTSVKLQDATLRGKPASSGSNKQLLGLVFSHAN